MDASGAARQTEGVIVISRINCRWIAKATAVRMAALVVTGAAVMCLAAPASAQATASAPTATEKTCLGCHGSQLSGGKVPSGPPDWPPAARLNSQGPDSALVRYPNADAFVALFRSGKRADGSAVQVMPFASFSKMSDTDLRALYLYLKSL